MTSTTQYKVPQKYTRPVVTPSANARDTGRPASFDTATTSGASAIHANAGWPNLGKLAMKRTPERTAST
jgi:hypothetical protein